MREGLRQAELLLVLLLIASQYWESDHMREGLRQAELLLVINC